jgi:hypothetical protein
MIGGLELLARKAGFQWFKEYINDLVGIAQTISRRHPILDSIPAPEISERRPATPKSLTETE